MYTKNQLGFLGLILGVVSVGVEALIMSPLLKDISDAYHVGQEVLGWSVGVYGISLAITAPVIAFWFRSASRKILMLTGLSLLVVSTLWCALAGSFESMLMARSICGIGAGIFIPACYAWIGQNVPFEVRGKVMGRVMAGWSIALIVAVPFGAWLGDVVGWRKTFAAISVVGIISLWMVSQLVELHRKHFEKSSSHVLLSLSDGDPRKILFLNFFDMLGFYGCYTFLGLFARENLGVSRGGFGVLVACYGVGLMISTMNARHIDKFGKEYSLVLSLIGLIGIFLCLFFASSYLASLGFCMLGWGVFQGAVQTSSATLMTERAGDGKGFAMACMSTTTYVAVAIGAGFGGFLMKRGGFDAIILCSLFSTLLALFIALRLNGFLLSRDFLDRNDFS